MCLATEKLGTSSGSWPYEEPETIGQSLWIPGRAVLKNNNINDHHNWTNNEADDHRILALIFYPCIEIGISCILQMRILKSREVKSFA